MKTNREQNKRETVLGLINEIYNNPLFARPRYTIIFSIAISFITVFYNSVLFSCQLYFLQNGLLVYVVIVMLLFVGKIFERSERIRLGVSIASILGFLYSGITLLISNIQYYFFGFRELAFSAKGLLAPKTTIQTFWIELGSQIVLLLILVSISAFSGFLASITHLKPISK